MKYNKSFTINLLSDFNENFHTISYSFEVLRKQNLGAVTSIPFFSLKSVQYYIESSYFCDTSRIFVLEPRYKLFKYLHLGTNLTEIIFTFCTVQQVTQMRFDKPLEQQLLMLIERNLKCDNRLKNNVVCKRFPSITLQLIIFMKSSKYL